MIMPASLHEMMTRVLSSAAWITLFLVNGCAASSSHGAADYFEGKALQLAIATENGDKEAVRHLMTDEDVDPDKIFARREGIPLVAWPLRAQNLEGLRALLENGADPNAREFNLVDGRKLGFNNAMVFAAKMDDPRFLELLLDHGGDPNTRSSARETLMYLAFLSGNQWKNVQLLVERGANINEANLGSADTILSLYTSRGGFNYAYWLLEHGADPTIKTKILTGSGEAPPMRMVDDIYWEITTPDLLPWQKKCRQWLIARNIPRPPMPEHIRRKREAFKFPTKEEDIPLL
ncbi:MAG: ankyrin repeat domain-containing protein [Stenotrophomonas sp.]